MHRGKNVTNSARGGGGGLLVKSWPGEVKACQAGVQQMQRIGDLK